MPKYIAPWTGVDDLEVGMYLSVREFKNDEEAINFLRNSRADIMKGRKVILIDVTEESQNFRNPGYRVVAILEF